MREHDLARGPACKPFIVRMCMSKPVVTNIVVVGGDWNVVQCTEKERKTVCRSKVDCCCYCLWCCALVPKWERERERERGGWMMTVVVMVMLMMMTTGHHILERCQPTTNQLERGNSTLFFWYKPLETLDIDKRYSQRKKERKKNSIKLKPKKWKNEKKIYLINYSYSKNIGCLVDWSWFLSFPFSSISSIIIMLLFFLKESFSFTIISTRVNSYSFTLYSKGKVFKVIRKEKVKRNMNNYACVSVICIITTTNLEIDLFISCIYIHMNNLKSSLSATTTTKIGLIIFLSYLFILYFLAISYYNYNTN